MLKVIKIILIVLVAIIFLNLTFFIIAYATDYDLTIKIKPYAFIFAHGGYICLYDGFGGYYHYTKVDGKRQPTKRVLEDLRKEGYEKIWISMCHQGDSDYVVYAGNDPSISDTKWGDDVSRIKTPRKVYPIYLGFFIYRINYKGEDILSNC